MDDSFPAAEPVASNQPTTERRLLPDINLLSCFAIAVNEVSRKDARFCCRNDIHICCGLDERFWWQSGDGTE